MLGTLSRPLEVLRISTVVDAGNAPEKTVPLEALRISTVVDAVSTALSVTLWKYQEFLLL